MVFGNPLQTKTLSERIEACEIEFEGFKNVVAALEEATTGSDSAVEHLVKFRNGYQKDMDEILEEKEMLTEDDLQTRGVFSLLPLGPSKTVKSIRRRTNTLARDVKGSNEEAGRITAIRNTHKHIYDYAYSGDFPSVKDLSPQRYYRPEELRKNYENHARNGCERLRCFEYSDENTGETSFIRSLRLREDVERAVTLLETKLSKGTYLTKDDKEKIRKEYIRLCYETVGASLFFPHSQFETSQLIQQHIEVSSCVLELIVIGEVAHSRSKEEKLYQKLKHDFEKLRRCIADVIYRNDTQQKLVDIAQENALADCGEQECLEIFRRLLISDENDEDLDSNIVYGWICRGCAAFTRDKIINLLSEQTTMPVLDFSTASDIVPVEITDEDGNDKGGFARIFQIGIQHSGHAALQKFKHEYETGFAFKSIKNYKIDGVNAARSYRIISQRVLREVIIWRKLRHPNIVPLLGIGINCPKSVFPSPIIPWMDGGDLRTYIENQPEEKYNIRERLSFLRDVADALRYMHNHKLQIIHGDLKANNILIHEGKAYLTDFGISSLASYKGLSTNVHGNWNFLAPELVRSVIEAERRQKATKRLEVYTDLARPNKATDVYAFGMTFCEVISGRTPHSNSHSDVRINRTSNPEGIPDVDNFVPDGTHRVFLKSCLNANPSMRPTSEDVLRKMKNFVSR